MKGSVFFCLRFWCSSKMMMPAKTTKTAAPKFRQSNNFIGSMFLLKRRKFCSIGPICRADSARNKPGRLWHERRANAGLGKPSWPSNALTTPPRMLRPNNYAPSLRTAERVDYLHKRLGAMYHPPPLRRRRQRQRHRPQGRRRALARLRLTGKTDPTSTSITSPITPARCSL